MIGFRSGMVCTLVILSFSLLTLGTAEEDVDSEDTMREQAEFIEREKAGINYAGVSAACVSNMQVLEAGLSDTVKYPWAGTWKNADGRDTWPDVGAELGSAFAEGSYDQCYKVKGNWQEVFKQGTNGTEISVGRFDFNTQYCKATWRSQGNLVGVSEGWCVPESCGPEDVQQMMASTPFTYTHAYCGEKPALSSNAGAIVALVISGLFVGLVLMASVIDGVDTFLKERKKAMDVENATPPVQLIGQKNMACDVAETDLQSGNTKPMEPVPVTPIKAEEKQPSAPYRALLSFSLFRTLPVVLHAGGSRAGYGSMNGLRFIAMAWIVLGHIWQLDLFVLTDPRNMFAKNYNGQFDLVVTWSHQIINNMNFSVETFFFLSGTLVTLSFMKTLKRMEKANCCARFKEMLLYVFHRYWRLTPLFAALIMIYGNLWPYFGSGPLYPETLAPAENCKKMWWANLLYIQNLYRGSGECMGWTWYLANDFQYYLIVPVFAFFLYWKPVFGGIFLFLGWAGSLAARAVLHSYTPSDDYWNIYVKPWCRFGPYAQGIAMGYIIYRTKCKVKMPWFVAVLGWAGAIALGLAVIFGTKNYGSFPRALQITVDTTKRDAFTLGIAWIVFACVNGYGGLINTFLSWNFLTVLSKLTYCGYLIHPMIHVLTLSRRRQLLYVQNITMIYQYFGTMCLTLICSLGLTCVFEVPFLALEKVMLPSHKKK